MPVYRTLCNLEDGARVIAKGGLWILPAGPAPDKALKLLSMGKISELHAPPFAAIPGWQTRGKKLDKLGLTVAGFIEAENKDLAPALKVPQAQIAAWKQELINWLTIPKDEG